MGGTLSAFLLLPTLFVREVPLGRLPTLPPPVDDPVPDFSVTAGLGSPLPGSLSTHGSSSENVNPGVGYLDGVTPPSSPEVDEPRTRVQRVWDWLVVNRPLVILLLVYGVTWGAFSPLFVYDLIYVSINILHHKPTDQDFDYTIQLASWLVLAQAVVFFLTSLLIGWVGHVVGYSRVYTLSLVFLSGGMLALLLLPYYIPALIALGATGVAYAAAFLDPVCVGRDLPPRHGRVMGWCPQWVQCFCPTNRERHFGARSLSCEPRRLVPTGHWDRVGFVQCTLFPLPCQTLRA